MTIQDFLAKLSEELKGFTIYKSREHYPFGCDLNRYWNKDGSRKEGVSFPNYPVNSKGLKDLYGNVVGTYYDVKRDSRIADALGTVSMTDRGAADMRYFLALMTVSAFSTYVLSVPTTQQLREIIELSGYSFYSLNRRATTIPQNFLSCFSGTKIQSISIILFELIRDVLDEQVGFERIKDKKVVLQKDKKNSAHARLLKVIDYMQIEGLIEFEFLPISILTHKKLDRIALGEIEFEEGNNGVGIEKVVVSQEEYEKDTVSDAKAEELKNEAQNYYEEVILKYALIHCKKVITQREGDGLGKKIENEERRFDSLLHYELNRMDRVAKRQVKNVAQFPKTATSNLYINQTIRDDGLTCDPLLNEMERILDAANGDFVKFHEKFLELLLTQRGGDEGAAQTITYLRQSLAATKAMSEYEVNIRNHIEALIAELYAEETEPLTADELGDFAESFLVALLCGDELTKLDCHKYCVVHIINSCDLPFSASIFPKLDDYDKWEEDYDIGENEELESLILEGNEKLSISIPEFPVLTSNVKISSIISKLADYRFDVPFAIRKSIVKKFQDLGVSKQRARDYAIIVSVLRMQRLKDSYTPDGYEFFPEVLFGNNLLVEEKDEEIIALRNERDEAFKKSKSAEKEGQRMRHEIAELQRKYDILREELERSNALIEEYELRDNDLDNEENVVEEQEDESIFPYHTNLKIMLFGGFDSFHSEIIKLLPDIKIIPPASHFDTTQFKNADIVFLQINKTSHSRYWAVLDTVRAANVLHFHLNKASPKRCAFEMVKRIKEVENK